MYKAIIISIVFGCLPICAMDKGMPHSIISYDGYSFPVSPHNVEQMKIFYPLCLENSSFRSEHNPLAIELFLKTIKGIEDGTIQSSYFQQQYDFVPYESKMKLSDYMQFDLNLKGSRKHKIAKSLMPIVRELGADQLAVVFTSLFFNKTNHDQMFSALLPRGKKSAFMHTINQLYHLYKPVTACGDSRMPIFHNYAGQKKAISGSGELVAEIDNKYSRIIVKKKDDQKILWVSEQTSFSNIALSGDGSRLVCIENVNSDCGATKGFILFVWDTTDWKLCVDSRFLLAGNIHTLSLNHDGTRAIASVSTSPFFRNNDLLAPLYENLIIDIRDNDAEVVDMIPVESVAQRMSWLSNDTFITSSVNSGSECEEWSLTGKKRTRLTFAQKVFVYGLYERKQDAESYRKRKEPFIAPLMTGYVKDFTVKFLPEEVGEWAQAVQDAYKFKN